MSTADRFGSVIKDMITETSGKGLINRMLFLCQKQLPPVMPRDVDKRQIDTSLPSFSLFYMIAAELRNVEFLFIGQPAKVEDYQFSTWDNTSKRMGKLVLDAQEQEKQNIIEKSDIDFIAKFTELVSRICSVTRAIDIACEIAEALIGQYKFEDGGKRLLMQNAPVNIRTKRQAVFISIASCKRAANLAYGVLRHTLALYNHSQNRIETVKAMIPSILTGALKDTPSSLSTAAQSKRTLEQFILVDFPHNFLMLGWLAKYPGTEKKTPFQRTPVITEAEASLAPLAIHIETEVYTQTFIGIWLYDVKSRRQKRADYLQMNKDLNNTFQFLKPFNDFVELAAYLKTHKSDRIFLVISHTFAVNVIPLFASQPSCLQSESLILRIYVYCTDKLSKERSKSDKEHIETVYRGKFLACSTLENLIENEGELISFNGFLSTTKNRDVAIVYAGATRPDQGLVLFELHIDRDVINKPFLILTPNETKVPAEDEVLFSIGTVWRIKRVMKPSEGNNMWSIELAASRYPDPNESELTDLLKQEIPQTPIFLTKIGQSDKAEKYYRMLLTDLQTEHEDYGYLGNYRKARALLEENKPVDLGALSVVYNNLGAAEYIKGHSYTRAFKDESPRTQTPQASRILRPTVAAEKPEVQIFPQPPW
ncbi:unnamed protein product [Didymodactylos carnosus]|uniref:Uncharacterized protein n=1 Tax=Didymodactylos carnosus TaxID=1234261 RepID=A0A8S2DJQ8_9BILA|nr:unnamed protein product [Didymodactylos carnosus]CAF3711654.1 unnamed protein product [Didymodactylos carnosus]